MKELSKKGALNIFFIFVLLISLSFVQASIDTKNSRGITTTSFFTSDEVFLKSSAGLCNNVYNNVNIYIIDSGNTGLTDARGESQNINLTTSYQIPTNTKIWAKPVAGNYDVVIDCDKDGTYSLLEPKTSFSVSFEKGTGNASIGKEISNHSWQYDPENPIFINEMLQLSLIAEGEDIDLTNIKIKAIGSGDDIQLDALEVYIDENNNGKLDEEEGIIGDSQPAYIMNNGESIVVLDYTLTSGVAENILIVYRMKEDIAEGEFSLSVTGIFGSGVKSEEEIKFSGFPINSNVKKVLAKKTCLGSLILEFEPNPVNQGEDVVAMISNLTGCDNRTVSLGTIPCISVSGNTGYCVIKNNTCQLNLSFSQNTKYYSCVDKNNNNDSLDIGETANKDLVVIAKEVEVEVEENVSEEIGELTNVTNEGNASITGGVISGLFESSLKSVFILLEITLLLILVVLIIISIRIKGNRQEKKKSKEVEEE